MAKKKITYSTSALKLLLATSAVLVVTVSYYLLEAFLPDSLADPMAGPSIFGRNFSVLAVVYNIVFAAALVTAAFKLFRWYTAKMTSARKKSAKRVIVGSGSKIVRQKTMYQGVSALVIVTLIGVFGALTSQPSNALTADTSTVKMTSASYTKVAYTRSPTGDTKYKNGDKDSSGRRIDTMQGGTTDGKYLYFAYGNAVAGGIIAKFDTNGKLIAKSDVFKPSQIGHANDMTYNPRLNKLVLAVWRPEATDTNKEKVAYIDPTTLKITGYDTVKPKATVTNICYEPTTDRYVANAKSYDASLNVVNKSLYGLTSTVMKSYNDKGTVGQGIGCDAKYVYVIRYYASATRPHTHVYVYDWSGSLKAVYSIKGLKDESENIFILNGELYMGVNNGSTYLSKSSDNKNDYVIRLKPTNDVAL